jgi:hypothetical protein
MRRFLIILSIIHSTYIFGALEALGGVVGGALATTFVGFAYHQHDRQEIQRLQDRSRRLESEHRELQNKLSTSGMLIKGDRGIHLCNPLNTLFNAALEKSDEAGMNAVLRLARNFDINGLDENGSTALHIGARAKNMPLLKYLCASGAHPDTQDIFGMTPLHYAAQANDVKVLTCLIKLGADPNRRNNNDQTPVMMALSANKREATEFLLALKHEKAQCERAPSPDHCTSLIGTLAMAMREQARDPNARDLADDMLSLIFKAFIERNPECAICYEPGPDSVCIIKCCEKGLCASCAEKINTVQGSCAFCRAEVTVESFLIYTRPTDPQPSSSHACSSSPVEYDLD